jgi:hypothetical protein
MRGQGISRGFLARDLRFTRLPAGWRRHPLFGLRVRGATATGAHAARDPQAKLRVTVKPLNNLVQPMNGVGKDSFSSLIARVNDTIVVRVPLR